MAEMFAEQARRQFYDHTAPSDPEAMAHLARQNLLILSGIDGSESKGKKRRGRIFESKTINECSTSRAH